MKDKGTPAGITTLYTPEHNSVAECSNRTIFSKVQGAVKDSDLLQEQWPKLLLGVVYITNCRLPYYSII
jgi:hypothetical protein